MHFPQQALTLSQRRFYLDVRDGDCDGRQGSLDRDEPPTDVVTHEGHDQVDVLDRRTDERIVAEGVVLHGG